MRFLCLHGRGTNSQVFEMQTAIRYALGDQHTYNFIEGSVPAPMASGIDSVVSAEDEFFQYVENTSMTSCTKALDDLEVYIKNEGPFDAVMAFSQGAGLAATLMMRKFKENPIQQRISPIFKCAIFFCGVLLEDCSVIKCVEGQSISYESDWGLIEIPTAHIWGKNDELFAQYGPMLSRLCKTKVKAEFVYEGGHEVPGPKHPEAFKQVVKFIKRTIDRATEVQ